MGACCSYAAGGKYSGGPLHKGYMNGDSEVPNNKPSLSGSRGLPSYVKLLLSASNLRSKDYSQTAGYMVVASAKKQDGSWEEIRRTEVVTNSLDPVWVTDVECIYNFEENQKLVFRIYYVDTKFSGTPTEDLQLNEQELLGEVECALVEIITSMGQMLTREIRKEQNATDENPQYLGNFGIKVEETLHSKSLVEIVFHCSELENKELFSKSDPFLKVSRLMGNGGRLQAYQTEVKANNIHPTWRPMKVTYQHLCGGDIVCPLIIECYDFNNSSGRHDIVGSVQVSLKELQEMAETRGSVELKRMSDGKVGGKLYVPSCTINKVSTFLDHIFCGYELSFMVGVDFTASNGNPLQQDSLHYIDPSGKPNVYQTVIQAFADIISIYDTRKQFYAWGFGGRPIDGPVSHCFALNGKISTAAEVTGIPGIMHAYTQALRHVALAGPTLFAPVISMAASIASEDISHERKRYSILLIITDGVITDSGPSITALVKASSLPLSVFIVGVGGADFSEMEILDPAKHGMVTSDGHIAVRDIVHFVAMRDLLNGTSLNKAPLAELPNQFLAYIDSKRAREKKIDIQEDRQAMPAPSLVATVTGPNSCPVQLRAEAWMSKLDLDLCSKGIVIS